MEGNVGSGSRGRREVTTSRGGHLGPSRDDGDADSGRTGTNSTPPTSMPIIVCQVRGYLWSWVRLRPGQAVVEVLGGVALYRGCPVLAVALYRTAFPPGAAWWGVAQEGIALAQSSSARLADRCRLGVRRKQDGLCDRGGRSPQEVGDPRGRRRRGQEAGDRQLRHREP